MPQIITAVYEQGLPHPAVSLSLHEQESVRILILPEKHIGLKPALSDSAKPAFFKRIIDKIRIAKYDDHIMLIFP